MRGVHVVTGGSSGIGRGVALALAERGEQVLAVGRDEHRLAEVAAAGITSIAADLDTAAGVACVVERATRDGGVVASVVHGAASTVAVGPWLDLERDELAGHFRTHVAAPIALTHALVAAGATPNTMVVIDSHAATTPRVGWSAYAIVKAAAQMSARAAAAELAGTRVIRVFPGAVESPLLRTVLEGPDDVPAVALYRGIEHDGNVSDPLDIGCEIARIVLDEPGDSTGDEVWHVGHSVPPSARS